MLNYDIFNDMKNIKKLNLIKILIYILKRYSIILLDNVYYITK